MGNSASKHSLESFCLAAWYEGRWWLWLLWPVSLLFQCVAWLRRYRLTKSACELAAPVVVVGNITLGGTGKTPVIIALVKYLQGQGHRPGVISRGYGSHAPHYPYLVTSQSPIRYSGDEPFLVASETGCPVMVGPSRVASATLLIEQHNCTLILSDDGLQHYGLHRAWELCLLDGQRLLGNGLCLPAGPLREPASRLNSVDCVLINGCSSERAVNREIDALSFRLEPQCWRNVKTGEQVTLDSVAVASADKVFAVTGIGNPQRFFTTLESVGVNAETRAFADHHPFSAADLSYAGEELLVMTAKDAVKCRDFAQPNWWYLSVEAQLPSAFYARFQAFLDRYQSLPKNTESLSNENS